MRHRRDHALAFSFLVLWAVLTSLGVELHGAHDRSTAMVLGGLPPGSLLGPKLSPLHPSPPREPHIL